MLNLGGEKGQYRSVRRFIFLLAKETEKDEEATKANTTSCEDECYTQYSDTRYSILDTQYSILNTRLKNE